MTRRPKKEVELLTTAEVNALIHVCSRRGPCGTRARALVVLLAAGGLRIAEALSLRVRDVDLHTGVVRIIHGKGGKSRHTCLPPAETELVRQWVEKRRTLDLPAGAPLLCSLRGTPLWKSYCHRLLQRLKHRAGISKRIHCHGLRHVFASRLAAENVPLPFIADLLGHASVATTSAYLRGLRGSPEALAASRAMIWTTPKPATREAANV